ncbi:MAG TPA: oxalurate catabolism protein HpxZ [Acidimicrobiales bacterium]|nr:oxalurate catabolism protein HpxZ [Acidimicrobiales bacterium]
MQLDRPDVIAEVADAFARYERALMDERHEELDEWFWADPRVVRFGIGEVQYGPAAIAAWRRRAPHVGHDRALDNTRIATFGTDAAVVTTEFARPGSPLLGRQSQTWIRIDGAWRIVHAHVSTLPVDAVERSGLPT